MGVRHVISQWLERAVVEVRAPALIRTISGSRTGFLGKESAVADQVDQRGGEVFMVEQGRTRVVVVTGADGRFDSRARGHSDYLRLSMHRRAIAMAAVGATGIAALALWKNV